MEQKEDGCPKRDLCGMYQNETPSKHLAILSDGYRVLICDNPDSGFDRCPNYKLLESKDDLGLSDQLLGDIGEIVRSFKG